jgi:hypothetical protein
MIAEDRVRGADEQRVAHRLEEKRNCCPCGDVLGRYGALSGDDGDLEGETDAEACEDLLADPFSAGGVDLEGVDKTCVDGGEDSAGKHKRVEVADSADQAAGHDGPDCGGEDER